MAQVASGNRSRMRTFRLLLICAAVVVALVVAVAAFIPGYVAPWSRLNNDEQELDLFSGRARFSRHFLYCRVGRELRETPLSEALAAGGGPERGEKWVKVNVFQTGASNSPHFYYHGAYFQIGQLAKFWEAGNLDPTARAKTARQLLRVWREGGSYWAADAYFDHLLECILARDPDQTTTADDIPNDLADKSLAAYAQERAQD